jgi:RNA polymerase sigma-70 factor (ECF subfamily)
MINFAILRPSLWNRIRKSALSSGVDTFGQRGRALRYFGVEDMIEHVPMEDHRKGAAALDEARLRQQAIGVKLRQMFDEVVNEAVPDEFLDILRKADKPAGERMSMSEAQVGRSPFDPPRRAFKKELVTLIPHLRAFARTLTGDPTAADDLAQDAMMKAWDARASFQLGTNMKAWTFMILRNQFYSEKRRSWRQSQLDQEAAERTLVAVDDPEAPVALDELRLSLAMLPAEQREALILVGAGGFAYEEAAEICGCAVGTVKSRVSRARRALQAILEAGAYDRDGAGG